MTKFSSGPLQMKVYVDKEINASEHFKLWFGSVDHMVEKVQKAGYQVFNSVPTMLTKDFFSLGGVKRRYCVVNGKDVLQYNVLGTNSIWYEPNVVFENKP